MADPWEVVGRRMVSDPYTRWTGGKVVHSPASTDLNDTPDWHAALTAAGSSRWTHPDTGDVYEIPDEDAPPLACTTYADLIRGEDLQRGFDERTRWMRLGRVGPCPVDPDRLGDLQPYLVERAR